MAFISVPAQWTSILDAVNLMIASLGEAPVTAYDPAPTNDVALAIGALNFEDLMLQSQGWHWNREDAFQLSLGTGGTVTLPDECLRVTSAYYAPNNAPSGPIDIVQRGPLLYDRIGHTNVFTVAPVADLILRLDWDSLPQVARAVIALRALQRFQGGVQQSQIALQLNAKDLAEAETLLEQHEDEVAGYNSVYGNVSTQSALYGAGGLRRNRGL